MIAKMALLSLPIQIGKKYIRRDGTVVEAQRPFKGFSNDCVFVGDSKDQIMKGRYHVWSKTGRVNGGQTDDDNENDLVAEYVEEVKEEPTGHKHAARMMEYAKDAAVMQEPWKNWESQNETTCEWQACLKHPTWSTARQYRRKQPKVVINGIKCVAGVKEAVIGEMYYLAVPSACTYATPIRYSEHLEWQLKAGLIHNTEHAAIAMSTAMLAFGHKQ